VKIRKIEFSELDRIVGLLAEKCPGIDVEEEKEHTEWHLKGFPEFCLAAEEGDEIVGFIISHLHENNLEIEELYAKREHESSWKLLLKEVLKKIPKVDTVSVWVEDFQELIKQLK